MNTQNTAAAYHEKRNLERAAAAGSERAKELLEELGECNNCGSPKAQDRFKACADCRAEWRLYSGRTPKSVRAAAPELLEALKKMVKATQKKNFITVAHLAATEAAAAITKAEGRV